jgi:hypothetical protein
MGRDLQGRHVHPLSAGNFAMYSPQGMGTVTVPESMGTVLS